MQLKCVKMKSISLFLILKIIITTCFSRHVLSHELSENLEKNESLIETPPFIVDVVESEINIPEDIESDKNDGTIKNIDSSLTENLEENLLSDVQAPMMLEVNKSQEEMIPVFSEWTQQQMQEAEKKQVELTNSTEPNKEIKNETLAKHQIVKMRQKNYASPDCGAKVLASNPEAQSTSSVLTDKDEYLLSPCTDRIWFVVELCDSIQAQRVELANFELFSSPLRSVSISVSNRFPTRDWTFAGQFEAKSERDVQVLILSSTLFGKFIRVDLAYTNTEHYCPLSFFRVFGTSEIEAFEVENEVVNSIDDDDELDHQAKVEKPNKKNLLDRAGEAVMSIVQKAAEVLVKGNGNYTKLDPVNKEAFSRDCISLSHNILCQTCSSDERDELDALISCKNDALSSLINDRSLNHLVNSVTCNSILGFGLKSKTFDSSTSFIISILPRKYVAALCNIVATDQKALPLRIEDIPGINSNLISKKDEVSLKNISKKVEDPGLCKQENYEAPVTNLANNSREVDLDQQKTVNASVSPENLNIFNVVEIEKRESDEKTSNSNIPEVDSEKIEEIAGEKEPQEEAVLENTSAELPTELTIEAPEIVTTIQPPTVDSKQPLTETKTEYEVKINGDIRSSNPPESVFLRLSNRIKTLEKNMSLSTQYLEELSRRYKKQIEDLQQSFSKQQSSIDDQRQKKKDSDRIDNEEKRILRENAVEMIRKMEYMEVILIVLSVFFVVQTILVIALFQRISILRKAFAAQSQESVHVLPPSSPTQRATARKRSKQRLRKISAPNILTQRSPVKNDFPQPAPVLNRTVSAPNKFNLIIAAPTPENKENFSEIHAMLEENDDILIPGFSELKLNDDIESVSLGTASTASAQSNEKKEKLSSNRSFKFKRRLSSPFQLKKSSMKKVSSDRTNQSWNKKAMSESPPRTNERNHISEIQKSKSFEEDESSVKFKKSNSFKKLFKKLF